MLLDDFGIFEYDLHYSVNDAHTSFGTLIFEFSTLDYITRDYFQENNFEGCAKPFY